MRLEQSFIDKLEKYIAEKYVSKRKHPSLPLYVLNYTAAVQFNWGPWDEVTLACRGLVIDDNYEIIARPFKKFFSYEQLEGKLPEGIPFTVEEKLDGSMLIIFEYQGQVVTATRGSFESEQAVDARRFLNERKTYYYAENGYTLICEYISKQNQIVVNYDYEGLVLLAVINPLGQEFDKFSTDVIAEELGYKRPKVYSFDTLEEILSYEEPNLEGFILHYENGERIKAKLAEYKRLHRLITGVSEKTVWEALRDNKIPEMLENTPDEFYQWVTEVKENLEAHYKHIEDAAIDYFRDLGGRKTNAEYYLHFAYPSILFKMLDKQDYSGIIWKLVTPKVTKVFKMVNEEEA